MTTSTATTSLFQPCVNVSDDGTIEIDWFDSYVNTVDTFYDHPERYEEPEGEPHSTLLDRLLGDHRNDPAGALRRLADYIEDPTFD